MPIGKGIALAAPSSRQNLHLVAFRYRGGSTDLVGDGIEVFEVFHDLGGIFHHSERRD